MEVVTTVIALSLVLLCVEIAALAEDQQKSNTNYVFLFYRKHLKQPKT